MTSFNGDRDRDSGGFEVDDFVSTHWQRRMVLIKGEYELWDPGFVVNVIKEGEEAAWKFFVLTETGLQFVSATSPDFDNIKLCNTLSSSVKLFSEGEILSYIRQKYRRRAIYTFLGPILYSVNPFQSIPIYDDRTRDTYILAGNGGYMHLLPPHVFVVADNAYRHMFMDPFDSELCEDQTIVITGDSGSGKTECSKHMIRYLMTLSSSVCSRYGESSDYEVEMEELVLAAIPIAESFGNAKNYANDNSSRYGRHIELCFCVDGYLDGALMRTYLLECTRVCHQPLNERNFHIFYEVLAGLDAERKQELGLASPSDFLYLCSVAMKEGGFPSKTRSEGAEERKDVSDKNAFHVLVEAMGKIGFSENIQNEVFKIVASVLHLGNIHFLPSPSHKSAREANKEEGEGYEGTVQFESDRQKSESARGLLLDRDYQRSVSQVCRLLSINEEQLLRSFVREAVTVGGRECDSNDADLELLLLNAYILRDRLARTLYSSLFNWIMVEINRALGERTSADCVSRIGILDTMGFEDYSANSLEQLCINYAAEKVHHHMVHSLFVQEKHIHLQEGIPWSSDPLANNQGLLDLFEQQRVGIFACIKSSVKHSGANEGEAIARTFQRRNKKIKITQESQERYKFTVSHSNRDVSYDVSGFLEKNRGIREINFSALFLSAEGRVQSFDSDNAKYLRSSSLPSSAESSAASSVNSMASFSNSNSNTPQKGHPDMGRTRRMQKNLEHSTSSLSDDSREVKLSVGRRSRAVCSSFQEDMTALLATVRRSRPHFVKCVNPNETRVAGDFHMEYVVRQFRLGELKSVVSLSQEPYPVRLTAEMWVRKYRVCLSPLGLSSLTEKIFTTLTTAYKLHSFHSAAKELASALSTAGIILSVLCRDKAIAADSEVLSGMIIASKHVFISTECHKYLEMLRVHSLEFIVHRLQSLRIHARGLINHHSARAVASQSLSYWRHALTKRVRRRVDATATIVKFLSYAQRSGKANAFKIQRGQKHAAGARTVQRWWRRNRLMPIAEVMRVTNTSTLESPLSSDKRQQQKDIARDGGGGGGVVTRMMWKAVVYASPLVLFPCMIFFSLQLRGRWSRR